jgi:hypothetical protein
MKTQPSLFPGHDLTFENARFDGKTIDSQLDTIRLGAQAGRVWSLMSDGHWRTLGEISLVTGDSEPGISARLRDFRKKHFGSHTVRRRRRGDGKRGLFEYQLIV